jgi:hypothetical protein
MPVALRQKSPQTWRRCGGSALPERRTRARQRSRVPAAARSDVPRDTRRDASGADGRVPADAQSPPCSFRHRVAALGSRSRAEPRRAARPCDRGSPPSAQLPTRRASVGVWELVPRIASTTSHTPSAPARTGSYARSSEHPPYLAGFCAPRHPSAQLVAKPALQARSRRFCATKETARRSGPSHCYPMLRIATSCT